MLSLLLHPIKAPGAHVAPVFVAECLSHAGTMPARGPSFGGSGGGVRGLLLLVELARDKGPLASPRPWTATSAGRTTRGG